MLNCLSPNTTVLFVVVDLTKVDLLPSSGECCLKTIMATITTHLRVELKFNLDCVNTFLKDILLSSKHTSVFNVSDVCLCE